MDINSRGRRPPGNSRFNPYPRRGNSRSNSQTGEPAQYPQPRLGRRSPRSNSRAIQNPYPNSTFCEGTELLNMSQTQNNLNAPAGNSRVFNVTVNCDGENTTEASPQHDFHDLTGTARADHEIYCSQLLTKKRGYPLWVPGPGRQLPVEYRRQGVNIGDVGIFTPTGEFDFLFNVFYPVTHPINRGGVPQGFSPLSLQELLCDIQENTIYGPNTYLASSSVRKTSMNWTSETSIDHRFESTAKEAAILMMPHGATTWNLLKTQGVRDAISRNAKDWYTYARSRDGRGRVVEDGGIRVVVGVDKVSSWGIATSACNAGQTASYVFKHDPTHTYKWDCIGGSGRVGPPKSEIHDLTEDNVAIENQCVFVRTINFTLEGNLRNPDLSSEAIQQPRSESGRFGPTSGNRGTLRGGHGSSGSSISGSSTHPMHGPSDSSESVNFDPVDPGVLHPSAALHNHLHEMFPDANMVITEDMNWISVLNDDDVVFPEPEDLCARVLDDYELQNDSGVIRLNRKSDTKLPAGTLGLTTLDNLNIERAEDVVVHEGASKAGRVYLQTNFPSPTEQRFHQHTMQHEHEIGSSGLRPRTRLRRREGESGNLWEESTPNSEGNDSIVSELSEVPNGGVANIKTAGDATALFDQMTELMKRAAEEEGGQPSSITTDISETLDMLLKGCGPVPDAMDRASMGIGDSSDSRDPDATPTLDDPFHGFFDFSFGRVEDDSKTPDLVSSSSMNPSPDINDDAAFSGRLSLDSPSSDVKTEDFSDPLGLGTWKEIDGGAAAYFQTTDWKYDIPLDSES